MLRWKIPIPQRERAALGLLVGGGVALQRAQLFLIGVLCLLLNEATIARRERGVFCFACGKTSDSPPSDVSGTR